MIKRHWFLLAAFALVMLSIPPRSTYAHDDLVDDVSFYWISRYGGSIVAHRCITGSWNWLTSTDLPPDSNTPEYGNQLGAWRWNESGCRDHIVATGLDDTEVLEIGIGASFNQPTGSLYEQEGTQVYEVTYWYGDISWRKLRDITSANTWCTRGNCTFRDPSPCTNDAVRIASSDVYADNSSEKIGFVSLVWSQACQAVWARAQSFYETTDYTVSLQFLNDYRGGRPTEYRGGSLSSYTAWTEMASQNVYNAKVCASLNVPSYRLTGSTCLDLR